MIGRISLVFFAVFLALISTVELDADTKIFGVSEIRPGMKGYGLTVFKGTEPERFEVEVVDVLERMLPKQDIILVKVSGHNLEETGIFQGMSGSPIFLDGKIAGALAYGWPYAKVSLAGITPIENMLAEMQRPLDSTPVASSTQKYKESYSYKDGQLVPVASPVMVSGLPPSIMDELSEMLGPYHLVPLQGGGASRPGSEPVNIKPGGAIGVSLVRGDIMMTAIGTVTWVEGSKVLAFGHPFINGGEVRFPITAARILTLLPRVSVSTKMGSALGEVGSLIQDRQSCIVGDLDSRVSMVPFVMDIKNERTGREETVNTEIVWETNFSTRLMMILLRSALSYAEASIGENTATTRIDVKFEGYPPVILENVYFNGSGPFNAAMLAPVMKMIFNPFEKVRIESMKINVKIDPEIKIAFIKRIWLEENEVAPGETGRLHVVLAPFGMDEIEKVLEFTVPEDAQPGSKLLLGAVGGMSVIPQVAPPVDFTGYIDIFKSFYKSTDIVVVRQMTSIGARVEGKVMTDLPPAAIRMLGAPNATGPMIQADMDMSSIRTEWVILGKAALPLNVAK